MAPRADLDDETQDVIEENVAPLTSRVAPVRSARYPKWSRKRATAILRSLQAGNTRTAASSAGGIARRTLSYWMATRPGFADEVELAEAIAERLHVQNVTKAMREGNLDASKFWLERRRAIDWGRVDRVDLIVRQERAREIAEELSEELGVPVSAQEVLAEYESLTRKALPPGSKQRR